MPYPLSANVNPGDPTLADHYNHLRADALYFGGDSATAANLQTLLGSYLDGVQLSGSGTTLTLAASAAEPCTFVLDGMPARIAEPLSLELTPAAYPGAAILWIFLLRTNSETQSFRLDATSLPAESAGRRRIGRLEWSGTKILPHSVLNIREVRAHATLPQPTICQGRLTLISGQAIPAADSGLQQTLFFTPCMGNHISLYSPLSGWETIRFNQISMPLDGFLPDYCYDTFIGLNNSGTPILTLIEWADQHERAEMLVYQDGIPLLASAKKWRYLGTIGMSDEDRTQDTRAERNIWNQYNQQRRPLTKQCAVSNQSSPAQNAWVPYAGDNALFVTAVIGQETGALTLHGLGSVSPLTANSSALGIGVDINTGSYAGNTNAADLSAFTFSPGEINTALQNMPGKGLLGQHRYHLITYTRNDTHFFNGTLYPGSKAGLSGYVWG